MLKYHSPSKVNWWTYGILLKRRLPHAAFKETWSENAVSQAKVTELLNN